MRIFLITSVLLIANFNSFAQPAVDTTVKAANLDLNKLQGLVTEIKDENNNLQNRLQTLEGSVTKDNLNKVIKTANIEKFKSDLSILRKRYEAGEDVIFHIIRETNNFNLSYKQLVLQSQFASLINPITYPEFITPLTTTLNSLKDKKPMPDVAKDLTNLSSTIPYLNNPIVNSGLSIVSYFIAKFNDKSKIDNANYGKMMCVLNFITNAETGYKSNVFGIISLSEKIDNYNKKLKEFFNLYLKSTGYSAGYDAYIASKTTDGSDFLNPTRESFFNSIISDTSKIGIINYASDKDDNVAYYIEQVKFQLSEYESILLDIDNSITGYEKFTIYITLLANSSCDGVKNQTKETFETVNKTVTEVREKFKVVLKENQVPADLKRVLFGL